MEAVLIAYETPEDFAKRNADPADFEAYTKPWYEFSQALREAGLTKDGAALEQPHTSTCVSVKGGARQVEDGPYADTREQIGGFFLLEVESLEEAVRWAKKCPSAATGGVEVRAVPNYMPEA